MQCKLSADDALNKRCFHFKFLFVHYREHQSVVFLSYQYPEESLSDDALLQDDDEEEDDNEPRSWRR